MEISSKFTTVHFTTTSWAKSESNTTADIYTNDYRKKVKKRAKGFCLNLRCKIQDELYKINDKHYRKNYSTDNFQEIHCPGCLHALYFTKNWELIEGYKDKEFHYKERPQLCK